MLSDLLLSGSESRIRHAVQFEGTGVGDGQDEEDDGTAEGNWAMSHSEEEIKDAIKAQRLICQKLLEIMDLQGDIDALLRDEHPSPFGSAKWKNARPEELQRLVMVTAIQFVLFEPDDWVEGGDKFRVAADKLLKEALSQLKWLKRKYHDGQDTDH